MGIETTIKSAKRSFLSAAAVSPPPHRGNEADCDKFVRQWQDAVTFEMKRRSVSQESHQISELIWSSWTCKMNCGG